MIEVVPSKQEFCVAHCFAECPFTHVLSGKTKQERKNINKQKAVDLRIRYANNLRQLQRQRIKKIMRIDSYAANFLGQSLCQLDVLNKTKNVEPFCLAIQNFAHMQRQSQIILHSILNLVRNSNKNKWVIVCLNVIMHKNEKILSEKQKIVLVQCLIEQMSKLDNCNNWLDYLSPAMQLINRLIQNNNQISQLSTDSVTKIEQVIIFLLEYHPHSNHLLSTTFRLIQYLANGINFSSKFVGHLITIRLFGKTSFNQHIQFVINHIHLFSEYRQQFTKFINWAIYYLASQKLFANQILFKIHKYQQQIIHNTSIETEQPGKHNKQGKSYRLGRAQYGKNSGLCLQFLQYALYCKNSVTVTDSKNQHNPFDSFQQHFQQFYKNRPIYNPNTNT